MARRLGFAVSRTFSSLATARTLIPAHIDERDLNQRVLESELLLAVYADVPVLVTADTPATAKRIAYAIQERLEPRQIPLAVVNSNVTATRLVELLQTRAGAVVLEDVGAFDDLAQAALLEFLEDRLQSSSDDPRRVRIISTGLADLYLRVKAGKFREALFYRLNTIHISVARRTNLDSY